MHSKNSKWFAEWCITNSERRWGRICQTRFLWWFEDREIKPIHPLKSPRRFHGAERILGLGKSPLVLNNLQFKNSKYLPTVCVLRSDRKPGLCKVSPEMNSLGVLKYYNLLFKYLYMYMVKIKESIKGWLNATSHTAWGWWFEVESGGARSNILVFVHCQHVIETLHFQWCLFKKDGVIKGTIYTSPAREYNF